jgi:hypothetical protein
MKKLFGVVLILAGILFLACVVFLLIQLGRQLSSSTFTAETIGFIIGYLFIVILEIILCLLFLKKGSNLFKK